MRDRIQPSIIGCQRGAGLILLLLAIMSIQALIIGSFQTYLATRQKQITNGRLISSRDNVFLEVKRYAGMPAALRNSVAVANQLPGVNADFAHCVTGDIILGCKADVTFPITLYGPLSGIPVGGPGPADSSHAQPQYYNQYGEVCSNQISSAACPIQVFTDFKAICPLGAGVCDKAESVTVSYFIRYIRQNSSDASGAMQLKSFSGTLTISTNEIVPTGSDLMTIATLSPTTTFTVVSTPTTVTTVATTTTESAASAANPTVATILAPVTVDPVTSTPVATADISVALTPISQPAEPVVAPVPQVAEPVTQPTVTEVIATVVDTIVSSPTTSTQTNTSITLGITTADRSTTSTVATETTVTTGNGIPEFGSGTGSELAPPLVTLTETIQTITTNSTSATATTVMTDPAVSDTSQTSTTPVQTTVATSDSSTPTVSAPSTAAVIGLAPTVDTNLAAPLVAADIAAAPVVTDTAIVTAPTVVADTVATPTLTIFPITSVDTTSVTTPVTTIDTTNLTTIDLGSAASTNVPSTTSAVSAISSATNSAIVTCATCSCGSGEAFVGGQCTAIDMF